MLGSRKNSKREKCLKMPQIPKRQVHDLLGAILARKTKFNQYLKTGHADVKIQSLIGKAEMPIFSIIFGVYARFETLYTHMTFARFAQGLAALHR